MYVYGCEHILPPEGLETQEPGFCAVLRVVDGGKSEVWLLLGGGTGRAKGEKSLEDRLPCGLQGDQPVK